MSKSQQRPTIPLPKSWNKQVRSAVLHVLSLAQYAAIYTRGWAADSTNSRVRLKAELDRTNQELFLLREESRIKDARLARIDPHRRPHYPPTDHHRGQHSQRKTRGTTGRGGRNRPAPPRGYLQIREPSLECRSHDRSDHCRFLVLLAPLHPSAAVAV